MGRNINEVIASLQEKRLARHIELVNEIVAEQKQRIKKEQDEKQKDPKRT